jgi:hypothetical protein
MLVLFGTQGLQVARNGNADAMDRYGPALLVSVAARHKTNVNPLSV